MCGIVGIAGEITADARKAFQQMLILDQLRGDHSTGCLSVRNYDGMVKISKAIGGPENLFETKKFQDQITDTSKLYVGHNRYATVGEVNVQNTHPFDFENVVGVHNGSLRTYKGLPGYGEYNVDSQVLYHAINEIGVEEALKHVQGAYALVWFDKKEQTLNFIRNAERPLSLQMSPDGKTIMWASEAWMMEAAAMRNGVKMEDSWLLKPDTLLSVPLTGAVRGKLELNITQNVKGGAAVVVPATPFRQPASSGGNNSWHGGATERVTSHSTAVVVSKTNTDTKGEKEAQKAPAPGVSQIRMTFDDLLAGFKGCDANGGKYVNLFRTNDLDSKYRLYLGKEDIGKILSGDRIEGEIGGVMVEGGVLIYKILHSTYKHFPATPASTTTAVQQRVLELNEKFGELLEGEQVDEEEEALFEDDKGRYLNKENFCKKFQFCSYCTGNIDPEEGYRFLKGDAILCDTCMNNRVIVDSLTD